MVDILMIKVFSKPCFIESLPYTILEHITDTRSVCISFSSILAIGVGGILRFSRIYTTELHVLLKKTVYHFK